MKAFFDPLHWFGRNDSLHLPSSIYIEAHHLDIAQGEFVFNLPPALGLQPKGSSSLTHMWVFFSCPRGTPMFESLSSTFLAVLDVRSSNPLCRRQIGEIGTPFRNQQQEQKHSYTYNKHFDSFH